jgi:hypothetical protein
MPVMPVTRELLITAYVNDHTKFALPKLITLESAAKLIDMAPTRLQELVDAQAVPFVRIDNGPALFYEPDFRRYVRDNLIRVFAPKGPIPEPICIYITDHPRPERGLPSALADYADRIVSLTVEPPLCGVYFLMVDGAIKYVGSSTDVRVRLAQHWADGKRFQGVLFMSTLPEERLRVEYGFIRGLKPEWNRNGYKRTDDA